MFLHKPLWLRLLQKSRFIFARASKVFMIYKTFFDSLLDKNNNQVTDEVIYG